jgi:transcriptional regulator with XRE-family HTH domain
MSAAPIRRHAPGAGAGSEQRPPSQSSYLALVTASLPIDDGERPARTPQQAFGARLKSARERRGITLKAMADATKVAASLFEALERGDVSRWPKGLYTRAFFRSYVTTIGLPADATLDEFLRLFPDEYTTVADPVSQTAEAEPAADPGPMRLTLAPEGRRAALHGISRSALTDGLAVLLIALALVWWTSLSLGTGAAVVALCHYPQLARLFRRHAPAWKHARFVSPRRAAPREQDVTATVTANS